VDQPAALALGLPERGGIPVELGAQRGQEPLEGHVRVGRLGEGGSDPQRRRQVAADLQLPFEPDGGAGVAEDGDHEAGVGAAAGRRVDPRQGEADGDLPAVGVQGGELARGADQLTLAGGPEPGETGGVGAAEALGHEHRQRPAEEVGRGVSQELGHSRIDVGDLPVRVGDDDGVGQGLEQRAGRQSRVQHACAAPRRSTASARTGSHTACQLPHTEC
jgi:hypothetical protein